MPSDEVIRATILDLACERGVGKTCCPSEVARMLQDDWRPLMNDIRRVASGMEGIEATQGGKTVEAMQATGPIRLGLRR